MSVGSISLGEESSGHNYCGEAHTTYTTDTVNIYLWTRRICSFPESHPSMTLPFSQESEALGSLAQPSTRHPIPTTHILSGLCLHPTHYTQ